ncbi:MAG: aldehyde dehydrogenase family protein [Motilibacteraceae bacterium]
MVAVDATAQATTATEGETVSLRHLVGGAWLEGSATAAARSLNPARPADVVATYAPADEALLRRALDAAARAHEAWDALGLVRRGQVLRRAGGVLERRAEEIARLLTREEGKTLPEARAEVELSAETLYYQGARGRGPDGTTYPSSHPDELIRTVRRPLGTVAVITPWNFPVQIPVWKIAPALLWGNCVVWKPASETVATAVALAEVFVEAGVPDGVLNLLLGPGTLGAALVGADDVAGITFTGSVPVGRSIAAAAAQRGAKVQLELGGHNAALVLPDVDPAEAAAHLVAGAMWSTGQKCTATRRIITVGTAGEALLPELARRVEAIRVGDGAHPDTQVGPLVSERARREVAEELEHALREGAEVLSRSPLPDDAAGSDGCYLAPTVLLGRPQLRICREEVFGPVTTVLHADDLDAAIALANATSFGLTAAVFTSDERAARRCVQQLEAGLVKVNAPTTGSELHVPFGGLKDSSVPAPREQNAETAADFFTWSKAAYLRTAAPWPAA